MADRTLPNIIITGTPGVGKTSHCERLADSTGLRHLSVNDVVKERQCHEGWDEEKKCFIVDEDKVRAGLILLTWHAADSAIAAGLDRGRG